MECYYGTVTNMDYIISWFKLNQIPYLFNNKKWHKTRTLYKYLSYAISFILTNTISRVLYWMIIYLGLMSPLGSSNLPTSTTGRRIACNSVLLRVGFTAALFVTKQAVVSYTTIPPLPIAWRYISVALALESPPPDVIWHSAL